MDKIIVCIGKQASAATRRESVREMQPSREIRGGARSDTCAFLSPMISPHFTDQAMESVDSLLVCTVCRKSTWLGIHAEAGLFIL